MAAPAHDKDHSATDAWTMVVSELSHLDATMIPRERTAFAREDPAYNRLVSVVWTADHQLDDEVLPVLEAAHHEEGFAVRAESVFDLGASLRVAIGRSREALPGAQGILRRMTIVRRWRYGDPDIDRDLRRIDQLELQLLNER